MLSLKRCSSERDDFVRNVMVDFEPHERFINMKYMMETVVARAAEFS